MGARAGKRSRSGGERPETARPAYALSTIQLRAELRDIEPGIWRRLVVPARLTLGELHEVLQIAFGWTNSHLHDFHVGSVRFGIRHIEDEWLLVDEAHAPLGGLVEEGTRFLYRYDFGDDWEHEIEIEEVSEPTAEPPRLECLAGARACPPEDCGGAPGYENLLRVLGDPKDEEHADLKQWVGRGFDPERFDAEKVNTKLGPLRRRLLREHEARRRGALRRR